MGQLLWQAWWGMRTGARLFGAALFVLLAVTPAMAETLMCRGPFYRFSYTTGTGAPFETVAFKWWTWFRMDIVPNPVAAGSGGANLSPRMCAFQSRTLTGADPRVIKIPLALGSDSRGHAGSDAFLSDALASCAADERCVLMMPGNLVHERAFAIRFQDHGAIHFQRNMWPPATGR